MKEIKLTKGFVALVDDEDFEYLNQFNWCFNIKDGAVAHTPKSGHNGKIMKMYKIIMNAPKKMEVDHINGDKLDNRKENLRVCTHSENMKNIKILRSNNTSGFKGVHKHRNKYVVNISNGSGKSEYVGIFQNKIDAAHVYDTEAIKRFGKFACLNFPKD
jgi:hypothetical protein